MGDENQEKIDFNQLKNDLRSSQQDLVDRIKQTVDEQFHHAIDHKLAPILEKQQRAVRTGKQDSVDLEEFADELEALGLEGKDGANILKLIDKAVSRKVPKSSAEDLDGEVDRLVNEKLSSKQAFETQKNAYDYQVMREFPEIVDKNSALFKQASKVWGSFPKDAQNLPQAMALATRQAASELGLLPLSSTEIMAREGQQFSGSNKGQGKVSAQVTKREEEFAQFFNVKNMDSYKKHLTRIRHNRSSQPDDSDY